MIAVLILSVAVLGLLFFADELDAGRCDLACPCGRRKMKSVLVTSESQVREIESGLAANCPWCLNQNRAREEAVPSSKGVDIHA